MTVEEANEFANQKAGKPPGWNARYIEALRMCGCTLVAVHERMFRPGTIDAPLPMEGESHGWPVPSIIVPLCQ